MAPSVHSGVDDMPPEELPISQVSDLIGNS
jgi:hypothetical protein